MAGDWHPIADDTNLKISKYLRFLCENAKVRDNILPGAMK